MKFTAKIIDTNRFFYRPQESSKNGPPSQTEGISPIPPPPNLRRPIIRISRSQPSTFRSSQNTPNYASLSPLTLHPITKALYCLFFRFHAEKGRHFSQTPTIFSLSLSLSSFTARLSHTHHSLHFLFIAFQSSQQWVKAGRNLDFLAGI